MSVFLLTLAIGQGLGWFLVWKSQQWQAKIAAQEVQYRENTPLQKVTLAQAVYQQSLVGDSEIRLDGKLYDIQTSELAKDSIKLVLYHDTPEEALYAELDNHFSSVDSQADATPHPMSFWIAQWLGASFLLPENMVMPMVKTARSKVVFNWHFPTATGVYAPPFTPPRIV